MLMLKRNPFLDESVTIEDNKIFLWLGGRAGSHSASKIDVTMPFLIGLHIGSKEYEKIESQIIS